MQTKDSLQNYSEQTRVHHSQTKITNRFRCIYYYVLVLSAIVIVVTNKEQIRHVHPRTFLTLNLWICRESV